MHRRVSWTSAAAAIVVTLLAAQPSPAHNSTAVLIELSGEAALATSRAVARVQDHLSKFKRVGSEGENDVRSYRVRLSETDSGYVLRFYLEPSAGTESKWDAAYRGAARFTVTVARPELDPVLSRPDREPAPR